MSMRRYRIINPKRFVISMLVITAVIMSIYVCNLGYYKTNYEVYEITISEGDTLWDIAELYADESIDVRKYIRDIKAYNNMETSELMPGDIIDIPISNKKREATFAQ